MLSRPIYGEFTSWVGWSAVFPCRAGVAALLFWLPAHFFCRPLGFPVLGFPALGVRARRATFQYGDLHLGQTFGCA
jgi:hypothetical protein